MAALGNLLIFALLASVHVFHVRRKLVGFRDTPRGLQPETNHCWAVTLHQYEFPVWVYVCVIMTSAYVGADIPTHLYFVSTMYACSCDGIPRDRVLVCVLYRRQYRFVYSGVALSAKPDNSGHSGLSIPAKSSEAPKGQGLSP